MKKNFLMMMLTSSLFAIVMSATACNYSSQKQEETNDTVPERSGPDNAPDDASIQVELTPEFIAAIQKYDKLGVFSEGLAAVCKNNKWGYINTKGEEVIPCQFLFEYPEEIACPFKSGLAEIPQNGKWGYINTQGEVIVKPKYDWLRGFNNGFAAVCKNDKWGFINTRGEEIVIPKYDEVGDYSEEFAAVCMNDKWGYINTKGEEIIPCQFPYNARSCPFKNGLAAIQINGEWGYMNTKGDVVIIPKYYEVAEFNQGLAAVWIQEGWDKKWGYINTKGEVVIPISKKDFSPGLFSDGLAACPINGWREFVVIDKTGKKVFKVDDGLYNQDSSPRFINGKLNVMTSNGPIVYNRKGEKVGGMKNFEGYGQFECKGGDNGVFLIVMDELKGEIFFGDGYDSSHKIQHYGYVDINGMDTFTPELKVRCKKLYEKAEKEAVLGDW